MPWDPSRKLGVIALLFVASGACGVAFELIASKMFALLLGSSVHCITAVVTAFMAGLAAGSWLAGRLVRGRRPLVTYAALEAGIGFSVAAFPEALDLCRPLIAFGYDRLGPESAAFLAFRFAVAMALLLVPTTMMGATLPVLAEALVAGDRGQGRVGGVVGLLYGVNTLGAVVGSLAGAYALLPALGITASLRTVALGNLVIALLALWIARGEPVWQGAIPSPTDPGPGAGPDVPSARWTAALGGTIGIGLGLTGFAAMAYQIAWTRALVLLLGSSTYAFALILAAYIGGLSAGSWLLSGLADRVRHPRWLAASLAVGVAVAAIVALPVIGHLPYLLIDVVVSFHRSWWAVQAAEAILIAAAILGPTFLMGGVLPAAARAHVQSGRGVAAGLGRLYAVNTAGNVLGAFVGGTVLVGRLGLERTVLVASLVQVAGALLIWGPVSAAGRPRWRMLALGAALPLAPVLVYLAVPRWDTSLMVSGPFLYAGMYSSASRKEGVGYREAIEKSGRILFYKEGVSATVAVRESPDRHRGLVVNGKTDASSYSDMKTQRLMGHLPAAIHPSPRRCLLLGLGSGVTLAALLEHPVEQVDVIEISPEVVEASAFFREENGDALQDPRVRLILEDGRNHLTLGSDSYDLIVCEPTNPWIAGVGNLFTREFFEGCKARLRPGGVMGQWFQAYSMAPEDFRAMVRTFLDVFGQATLWRSTRGVDYIAVAGTGPARIDLAVMRTRLQRGAVKAGLEELGIEDELDLMAHFVAGPRRLEQFTRGSPVITDDSLHLELRAPRHIYSHSGASRGEVEDSREPPWSYVVDSSGRPVDMGVVARATLARLHCISAIGYLKAGELKQAIRELKEARALAPGDRGTRKVIKVVCSGVATLMTRMGKGAEAIVWLEKVAARHPDDADLKNEIGNLQVDRGDLVRAEAEYRRCLAVEPGHVAAHKNLGSLLVRQGRLPEAIGAYERAAQLAPHDARVHNNLGLLYERIDDIDRARREYSRATRADPAFEEARSNLQSTFGRYQ